MGQYQLAQLKQYNSDVIASYFGYRPWLVWGRILEIIWCFAIFIFSLKWDEWQNHQVEQTSQQGKRATQLREMLTHLGPTFIKVGQALSTRPDLIRKDFLAELVKLQDQLPPFENQLAREIIETELNRPISQLFSDLSPKPVAAASKSPTSKPPTNLDP